MLTKPFKPLALAFLVNLIISVEDKIKYKYKYKIDGAEGLVFFHFVSVLQGLYGLSCFGRRRVASVNQASWASFLK